MEGSVDLLLVSASKQLKGRSRRRFLAEVCTTLCDGSPRKAEARFGWGREAVAKGLCDPEESKSTSAKKLRRGRQRSEEKNPQLAIEIRLIVEPHTQSDPELKTSRQYTNLSAAEVRQALIERGYQGDRLPSERTLRDILNRMNYRLKPLSFPARWQKGKPLKKTEETDAIFENIKAVRTASQDDPKTLEISLDTKTKVKLGEYSLGGKNENRQPG